MNYAYRWTKTRGAPFRRRSAAVLGLALLVAAGCSSSHPKSAPPGPSGSPTSSPTPGPPAPSSRVASPGGAVAPPAQGIYLGFFDNALGKNGTAHGGMDTYNQLTSFESSIRRSFAIDLHYSQWSTPLDSPSVQDDLRAGRVPLISWECGDSDAQVASGADDALLISQAKAVAALGKPVMIRWFWEMEFTGSNGGKQGARAKSCIGSGGP